MPLSAVQMPAMPPPSLHLPEFPNPAPRLLPGSYHGEPLSEPMCQLVTNALQYYLSQGEVEKEWSESY
jgi:hypothetical protein